MYNPSIKKLLGVFYEFLIKLYHFIFPTNFVILDCEIDHDICFILGRPFKATQRALVDVECGETKF